MRLVGSKEAQAVTGLSADQLREWAGRRGLVAPDVRASGKGTHARFSWRTLVVLRVAGAMKAYLHVELGAYRGLFKELQERLAGQPFHALSDLVVVITGGVRVSLRRTSDLIEDSDAPVVLIRLASHLAAVMRGFGIPEPVVQLPLFPAVGLQ